MSWPRVNWSPWARIAAVLGAAFGLGLGSVVLGATFRAMFPPPPCVANCEKFDFGFFGNIGLGVMFYSAIGLLLTAALFVLTKLIRVFDNDQNKPIRLLDADVVEGKPKG
jgi:hypothetical protein